MGKNDKKKADPSKVAAKKARIQAKQDKATTKRNKKELKEQGEEDIETILAEYQEKERHRTAVTITPCSQPSPRSNFSMVSLSNSEMLLFGGENCDGESTTVFNDLFRWNIERNEWKLIESLNTPPPRCSHQAVVFKDTMYMFGGEYATLDQFHHYRDMWALDLKTNVWREINCNTGDAPSARSGHRMVVWRSYIVLFGGFYEALKEVRWFGDLYLFSFQDERWISVPVKPYAPVPKPRSGFLMTIHPADDAVFVFGGYSREKVAASATAGNSKAAASKSEGKIHTDMWMLSLRGVIASGSGGGLQRLDTSKASWQKISNKGSPPSPRCGASMITYKNKGLYFGGVFDSEGPRHSIMSMFYNDLYAFDFERKRWYALGLKVPKLGASKEEARQRRRDKAREKGEKGVVADDDDDGEDSGSDDESEGEEGGADEGQDEEDALEKTHQNGNYFGYIDNDGNVVYINIDDLPDDEEEADASTGMAVVSGEEESKGDNEWVSVEAVGLEEAMAASSLSDGGAPASSGGEGKGEDWEKEDTVESVAIVPVDDLAGMVLIDNDDIREMRDPRHHTEEVVETNPLRRYFKEHRTCPVGRINAGLATKGSTLLVYGAYHNAEAGYHRPLRFFENQKISCDVNVCVGGVTEIGDVEVTLDDCWSLDLNKRDRWKSVLEGTMCDLVWKGDIDDDGSEMTGEGDDSDSDGSDDDDDDDQDDEMEIISKKKSKDKSKDKSQDKSRKKDRGAGGGGGIRAEVQALRESLPSQGEDHRLYPLSGSAVKASAATAAAVAEGGAVVETLRDFYSRSSDYWKQLAVEQWQAGIVNIEGDLIPTVSTADEAGDTSGADPSTSDAGNGLLTAVRLSEKEVKRIAFNVCQREYAAVLPVVTRMAELEECMAEEEGQRGGSKANKRR